MRFEWQTLRKSDGYRRSASTHLTRWNPIIFLPANEPVRKLMGQLCYASLRLAHSV
jgi:hypothetical protein